MSSSPAHWFVVREPGTWALTPVPPTDPLPAGIDDVLTHLRESVVEPTSASTDEPTTASDGDPAVGADDVLTPAWKVVGELAGGRFVVTSPAGVEVRLDEADLRLLDALCAPFTPRQLAATLDADVDETRARCARLVRGGMATCAPAPEPLITRPAEDQPPAPAPEVPVHHPSVKERVLVAYRLSSKLRPVRELVERVGSRRSH